MVFMATSEQERTQCFTGRNYDCACPYLRLYVSSLSCAFDGKVAADECVRPSLLSLRQCSGDKFAKHFLCDEPLIGR